MDSLGRLLKDVRARHSLTQTEAAERIGIEQSYLSKLESDQAWASLEVLTRICKAYGTDVKAVLGQIDQASLRGNLQYQGFLQRQSELTRRNWIVGGSALAIICICMIAFGFGFGFVRETQSTVELTHTPVSLKLEDVEGREVLQMIADYGGLTIKGTEGLEGRITHLELKNEPWDKALAIVAGELGYRIEITGAKVELIPVTTILKSG